MTEKSTTQTSPSLIKIVGINLVVLIVLVLFFELLARFFLWTPVNPYDSFVRQTGESVEYSAAQPYYGDADANLYRGGFGDLVPDQTGIWNLLPEMPYRVVTNSAGLRNIEELDDDTYRILAIGDSYTFGPFLPNEYTWPLQLQAMLRRNYPDTPLQVLNAGVQGYTILDQLAYMQEKGLALDPDRVILNITLNDISELHPSRRSAYGRENRDALFPEADATGADDTQPQLTARDRARQFLENFALFNLVRIVRFNLTVAQLENDAAPIASSEDSEASAGMRDPYENNYLRITWLEPDSDDSQVYWQQYEDGLRDFIALLEENEIPLIIAVFPAFNQLEPDSYPTHPQAFIEAIADDTGTTYLDLLPAYRDNGTIESLYLLQYDASYIPTMIDPLWEDTFMYVGDGHPSRYGYYVAADALVPLINISQD